MPPTNETIRGNLASVENLAKDEYGASLDSLLHQDRLGAERLGRLVGVSLKEKFAEPTAIDPNDYDATKTGAFRAWRAKSNLALTPLRETQEYLTVKTISQAADDLGALYYIQSGFEGSWFRDLACAIRPAFCGHDESLVKEIGFEIAKQPLEEHIKAFLSHLDGAVPWFGNVPPLTATLMALFIIKTSLKGFCEWTKDNGALIIAQIGTYS